jgi:hypothetical protein
LEAKESFNGLKKFDLDLSPTKLRAMEKMDLVNIPAEPLFDSKDVKQKMRLGFRLNVDTSAEKDHTSEMLATHPEIELPVFHPSAIIEEPFMEHSDEHLEL